MGLGSSAYGEKKKGFKLSRGLRYRLCLRALMCDLEACTSQSLNPSKKEREAEHKLWIFLLAGGPVPSGSIHLFAYVLFLDL